MSDAGTATSSSTRGILHRASLLLVAQLLAAPISILVNALAARRLGAAEYGLLFQAMTFSGFAFLFIEWGQPAVLTGQVAAHRARAGELLGSSLAYRVSVAVAATVLLPVLAALAGYQGAFVPVLALALLAGVFATASGACQDVYTGYERTDFAAGSVVGWQLLSAAVVVPTLLAGGGLYGFLAAQVACAALGAAFVLWMAPRMKVPRLSIRMDTIRDLLRRGRPFLAFGIVQALQPMADASMLSWFGTDNEMGWYGASRKLCGMLVYPASALLFALYPTLCRLRSEDIHAFRNTTVDALHAVTVVAVPVAVGALMYPGLGVGLFGNDSYAPAADNLRVLAPWLLLVYFSMPVGSCLTAAGRQTAWTVVMLGGALTSIALDPVLIPWFHQHAGNGGLGVCVAGLVGEIVTLTGALCLLPAGVLSGLSRRRMLSVMLAGAVMAAVAWLSSPLNDWAGATLAVLAYAGCVQLGGGVDFRQLRDFIAGLRRQAGG